MLQLHLSAHSRLFDYWLELEHFAIRRSDAIVGVSKPMGSHVSRLGGCKKYWTVPISVDLAAFEFCKDDRVRLRSQYGWGQEDLVAVYSGSLGLGGLNKKPLTKLLAMLKRSERNLKIMILSNESELSVKKLCRDAGIDSNLVTIVSLSPNELGPYLSAADFGFHALPKQPDSSSRLGTKTIEYWANGLPVVLSSTVGAAANICTTHDLGIVVDLEANTQTKITFLPSRQGREHTFKAFDIEQFGLQRISDLYVGIYQSIVS